MTPRREVLIFGVLFISSAFIRFYQIGQESIWFDEWHSMTLAADGDPMNVIEAAARDVHPPLYFLFLKLWSFLISPSLISARSFSAFVSALALIPFWRLARRWIGPGAALIASCLMGLSPFQLWYAQEARMYALLVLGETLVLLCAVSLFSPEASRREGKRLGAGLGLLVFTALLLGTHFFALFVILFVGLFGILQLIRPEGRSKPRSTWFLIWSVWTLIWILTGLFQLADRLATGEGIDWIPPAGAGMFVGILFAFTYGVFIIPRPVWIILPLVAGFGVALLFAFMRPKKLAPVSAGFAVMSRADGEELHEFPSPVLIGVPLAVPGVVQIAHHRG